VDTVVINKRGTITEGKPSVTDIISLSDLDDNDLLAIAASVQALSEFPLASAIVSEAKRSGLAIAEPERIIPHPGKGIETVIRENNYNSGGPVILQDTESTSPWRFRLSASSRSRERSPSRSVCDGKMSRDRRGLRRRPKRQPGRRSPR
jgi:cation transport ATPase